MVESLEQHREISAAERQPRKFRGCNLGQSQLAKRSRQGSRKAGRSGNGPKVREFVVTDRFKRRSGSDGFRAELAGRRSPIERKNGSRKTQGQLGQAETVKPQRGTRLDRDRPRQVVSRTSRRADQQKVG